MVGLLGLVPSALGVLTYEGFDYPAGDVEGQSGGLAWEDPWVTSNGIGTYEVSTASGSLAYGPLVTSGGLLTTQGSFTDTVGRMVDTSPGGPWDAAGFVASGVLANNTVWGSFLVQRVSNVAIEAAFHQADPRFMSPGGSSVYLEYLNVENHWRVAHDGSLFAQDLPSSPLGETVLFVLRWNFGTAPNSSSIHLWMDPSPSLLGGPDLLVSTANWSATGLPHITASFNTFSLRGGWENNGTLFDELRLGTSFAAVTPIPEPSSALLLLSAAGLFLFLRRQTTNAHQKNHGHHETQPGGDFSRTSLS